jgi:hypothetical protein
MNMKKKLKRKLINMQNRYGKLAGKTMWILWKKTENIGSTNGK